MLIYSFCLCRFCSLKTLRDVKIEIEKGARCEHKADRVVLSPLIENRFPRGSARQSATRASSQLRSLSGMTLNSRPPRVKEQTPSLVSRLSDWHTIPVGGPRYSSNPRLPARDQPCLLFADQSNQTEWNQRSRKVSVLRVSRAAGGLLINPEAFWYVFVMERA